jgi:CxxC motif-containing protein (DUF1111 family)
MRTRIWIALWGVLLGGCAREVPSAQPGAAWPGLPEAELRTFAAGRDLLFREFSPREGLGPTFNQARCSSCHDVPTLGGAGVERIQKATRYEAGRCDLLVEQGGDLFQQRVTPALRAHGYQTELVSRRANGFVSMAAPALYGLGALEAIPDKEILKRADPDDRDADGISGRAGRAFDGQLGRFGRKTTFSNIRHFVEGALSGEMGLTTTAFPNEESVGGKPVPPDSDPAADPEINAEQVALLTRFVQLLAFPRTETPKAARDTIALGERMFKRIGCAACHTPVLRTGNSPIRALNHKAVPLYSDLLLHDLGPGLATVCAPGVAPSEWRTAPLYGLRLRPQLLHDGRVQIVESAIRLHGGEAESSRALFETLSAEENAALLRFLNSL